MPLDPDLTEFATASPVLVNFDFVDIQNGVGVSSYTCFISENDTGKSFGLTSKNLRSAENVYSLQVPSTPNTEEVDFDLTPFQLTQTIKGTAIITGSHSWDKTNINQRGFLTGALYKWDGSTETLLGSDRTIEYGDLDQDDNYVFLIDIAETVFEVGDVLRLKFTITTTGSSGTAATFVIGTDPADRDGGSLTPSSEDVTTITRIDIPFKLDL